MLVLWLAGGVVYSLHHRGWINAAATFLHRLRDPLPPSGVHEPSRKRPPAPSVFVEPGRVVRAAAEARAERLNWNKRRLALAQSEPPDASNLTDKLGFVTTSSDRTARRFSLWSYAFDVTLPIIQLGRFGVYSPDNAVVRGFSYLHHILGWWLGALTIL